VETLLVLSVVIAGLWVFGRAARQVEFFGDEGRYIHRARFFYYLFVQHDVTRSEWSDRDGNLTHTAMMLPHYLIGASLWAADYRVEDLPRMYSWKASPELNRRWGRVPDERMLMQARLPMVLLAVGSVLLLYFLGRALGGVVAGLTAALIAASSPLAREYLVRVGSDAPLAFLVLLGLLFSVLGMRRGGGVPMGWAVAVGLALGLAAGSKLTALLSWAAVVGWAMLAMTAAWRCPLVYRSRVACLWPAARGWFIALLVASGVFVLINPHLYPDPLLHARHLIESRAADMQEMYAYFKADAVRNPLDRPRHVIVGSLVQAPLFGSRGFPIEAALAVVGVAALIHRTLRDWWQSAVLSTDTLVLLTVLCYFAGVSAGLLLAFERYFLPTLLLGALLSGLGLSAITRRLPALGAALKNRRPAPRVTASGSSPAAST
jgi:4-amino-4-deoxy-L-arabinose transferase-like glycosyltransferase